MYGLRRTLRAVFHVVVDSRFPGCQRISPAISILDRFSPDACIIAWQRGIYLLFVFNLKKVTDHSHEFYAYPVSIHVLAGVDQFRDCRSRT